MKKHLLTLTALLTSSFFSFAQDAQVSTTLINKMNQPCVSANYNYDGHILEGALSNKLSNAKIGKYSKATDDFKVYKGVVYNALNDYKIDLYYKVEDKKTTSTVYLLASKGYDNFISPEVDPTLYANAIKYLNTLINDATAFKLKEDIASKEKEVASMEKKKKSFKKSESKIVKSKSKLESKISKKNLEINPYKSDMENQIKLLEVAKAKTATLDQMDALKKEVGKQEDAVKSSTKKYENAVSSLDDMTKDLKKIEDELEASKQEQQKHQAGIDKINDELKSLKAELATIKL